MLNLNLEILKSYVVELNYFSKKGKQTNFCFIIQTLLICLILNYLFTVFYIIKPNMTYRFLN